tara:strand:+ start:587 stop:1222 length:636 start_codon:yes stop_codon:yes gene_type:complete
MNLNVYYWRWTGGLPENVCDQIIKTAEQKGSKKAIVGEYGDRDIERFPMSKIEKEKLNDIRDSNVQWLTNRWIYDEIHPFVYWANNKAGWNFNMDYSEACQITTYEKEQFYDWHCDSGPTPMINPDPNYNGKVRKLSMTVQLSKPEEYEGGEFQIDFRNSKDGSPVVRDAEGIDAKGSVIVFPSHLWHRVKPVTRGRRRSLVMWTLGKPFK